jgi:AcrR family transcriptional regulator
MGRPRTFDEEQLLDCAQETFWANGYAATRVEDIGSASGVGNGSIYAAYGSKLGLFLAVFGRYCEGRVRLVDSVVSAHSGTFEEAVANYLDAIIADCTTHPDRRGCLMLNSIAELGSRHPEVVDISGRTIRALEEILQARVVQAISDGELALPAEESECLSAHIVLVSQGLIQLSRTGASTDKLHTIARTSSRMSSLLTAA